MALANRRSRLALAMVARKNPRLIIRRRKRSVQVKGPGKNVTKGHKKNFLDLPAEIREKVYKNLLISRHPIEAEVMYHHEFGFFGGSGGRWIDSGAHFNTRHYIDRPQDIHGAILRTTRLIHNEACAVLYGCNSFTAPDLTKAKFEFAFHLRDKASLIQRLRIERYSPEGLLYDRPTLIQRNIEFHLAAEFLTGLKSLQIDGLTPFTISGKCKFPEIRIIRYIVEETGLARTFTHRHREHVRFAADTEKQKRSETAFDIFAEIRNYNASVTKKRMKTVERNQQFERERQEREEEEEHRAKAEKRTP